MGWRWKSAVLLNCTLFDECVMGKLCGYCLKVIKKSHFGSLGVLCWSTWGRKVINPIASQCAYIPSANAVIIYVCIIIHQPLHHPRIISYLIIWDMQSQQSQKPLNLINQLILPFLFQNYLYYLSVNQTYLQIYNFTYFMGINSIVLIEIRFWSKF